MQYQRELDRSAGLPQKGYDECRWLYESSTDLGLRTQIRVIKKRDDDACAGLKAAWDARIKRRAREKEENEEHDNEDDDEDDNEEEEEDLDVERERMGEDKDEDEDDDEVTGAGAVFTQQLTLRYVLGLAIECVYITQLIHRQPTSMSHSGLGSGRACCAVGWASCVCVLLGAMGPLAISE